MAQYLGVSQIETNSVSVTGGVCGPGVDSANTHLTFDLPLRTSIVPKYCRGSGTPTFTRASNAYVQDHEGILRLCKSGEARFHGARRVRNYLLSSFVQEAGVAGWSAYAGSTYSVTTGIDDPRGGTDARRVTLLTGAPYSGFLASVSGSPLYANGESGVSSAWFRAPSGTLNIQLYAQGTDNVRTELTIDATWRRYASTPADDSGKSLYWIVGFADGAGGILDVFEPQLENVSGQSNQAPAEYVSAGVLSAPYHGANVDGVKYFGTENGNSLVGNVVVEATGAAIAEDTLKGYLSEGSNTNRCLYSEDFSNAAWVKSNVTVTANSTTAPNGTTTADTLTATAANGTVIQDLGVVASAPKSGSVYLKRKTGTGNIDMTLDNGATWTTKTLTAAWQRFDISQTLANEDFGIRIVTSGDEVYAWGGDVQTCYASVTGTNLTTSYIATTSAAASRNEDFLTFAYPGNIAEVGWTVYCEQIRLTDVGVSQPANSPLSVGVYVGNAYIGLGGYRDSNGVIGSWPNVWDAVIFTTLWPSAGSVIKTVVQMLADGATFVLGTNGTITGGVASIAKSSSWSGDIGIGCVVGGSSDSRTIAVRNVRIWSAVMPILTDGTVASQISG